MSRGPRCLYIDSVRAKSKAHFNILIVYLNKLKYNRVMQNGDSDGKKKNFTRVAHFSVHFFDVVFS